jgi:hypothetical protein
VDGYNTNGTGYINIGCTPTGTDGGYITKMTFTKYGLIPKSASGSATTYYTDGLYYNNTQVDYVVCGGYGTALIGAFATNLRCAINLSVQAVGASISCKPLASIEEVE